MTGERIKKLRKEKGLTQQQLGEMLGVQKSAIAKYENGRVPNLKKETPVSYTHLTLPTTSNV